MKFLLRKAILILMLIGLVSGCAPFSAHIPQRTEQDIYLEGVESIKVEIRGGKLSFIGESRETLKMVTTLSEPPSVSNSSDQTQLTLALQESTRGQVTTLYVPNDLHLIVESFSARLQMDRVTGTLNAFTVAGDIFYQDGEGEAILRSGRGNIYVSGGEGELTVLGEHGAVEVTGFLGSTSLSTIMGEISYQAPRITTGPVALETDHGSVDVIVPTSSNYQIRAATTSGVLQCVGSHLQKTLAGCEGKTGRGKYPLTIRSVSGRIYLRESSVNQDATNE
mgnify:CR=1 FL=1